MALSNGKSYEWLEYLSNDIGHRLSGSVNAERAIKWGKEELLSISDMVWLQPVMVPKWVRGAPEYAHIESTSGKTVFIQNEEPIYFASLSFGKNLLPDFKNKFRFVNGGFFIRPLSRSGINFASIFGNLPIFCEYYLLFILCKINFA